jgi:hypothetical protein
MSHLCQRQHKSILSNGRQFSGLILWPTPNYGPTPIIIHLCTESTSFLVFAFNFFNTV